jgi:hypothetical protein
MHYPIAPYPQYRAPVHRKLTPAEIREAEIEMDARLSESRALYRRFKQRSNIAKTRFYSVAMKLLERERQIFHAEQARL